MVPDKKKNIALLIAAGFLLAPLFDGWPYGFFTLLRFVVFASSVYVAWLAYEIQNENWRNKIIPLSGDEVEIIKNKECF